MRPRDLITAAALLATAGSLHADLLITEIVDGTLSGGQPKWVELTNTGATDLDLASYSIGTFSGGATTLHGGAATVLTGTLVAGDSYVIGYDFDPGGGAGTFWSVYGQDADFYTGSAEYNGDDVIALFQGAATGDGSDATLIDVYGEIGIDGTGQSWEYKDSFSYRCGSTANGGTFDVGDWYVEGPEGLETGCGSVDSCERDNLLILTTPWVHTTCVWSFVPYCFGDPGAIDCPCGNSNDGSVPGSGCANGSYSSGARLTGQGNASVTSDTVVLATTHTEPNQSGLYFQASNRIHNVPFWDGIQCAGGDLRRLGVRFSDASGYSDTSAWTTPISQKAGNVSPGVTRHYQCWYRNPTSSPCGSESNASNAISITWTP